jgi:tryptophan synthase alpha chain
MSEITKTFGGLKTRCEGALISYVTAGDPEPSRTPAIIDALVAGGVDIVELGIPFSDPIADGPTIQAASVRALKAGTTLKGTLKTVEEIKGRHKVPLVIMTYYNPLFRMQLKTFFESASACGVNGIIVPDLPVEEADQFKKLADASGIDTVFLAAPSTPSDRLREILKFSSGFLYLVSVFGVTGTREKIQATTVELIKKTLEVTRGRIPLSVGFGISKPEHARTVLQSGADAIIVGSGFVEIIQRNGNNEEEMLRALKQYAHELKGATGKNSNV